MKRGPDTEVLEREVSPTLPASVGATVDIQVATARRFPRSIGTFQRRATEMATLTPDVAASCVYALPRGGKNIEGPSARLAEICAHAWGNLRIQAGTTDDGDGRFVTGRGEAWDVEANVAIGFEVKRRITDSRGNSYNDDMITVTGNAAASIALRNAVFKAIPTSFWKPIYDECRKVIAGDARTFASRRDEMLKHFAVMGVTEVRLCAGIGVKGKDDITLDHMVPLRGIYNALKDGETTIEQAFPESGGLGAVQSGQRRSQSAKPATTTEASGDTSDASASKPAESAKPAEATAAAPAASTESLSIAEAITRRPVGRVIKIVPKGDGAFIQLSSGFTVQSKSAEMIAAANKLLGTDTVVEFGTRPSSDPTKFLPTLEEIQPAFDEAAS